MTPGDRLTRLEYYYVNHTPVGGRDRFGERCAVYTPTNTAYGVIRFEDGLEVQGARSDARRKPPHALLKGANSRRKELQ
jgi:hypothetical protein